MDTDASEEPKAKRQCLEDKKENDTEENEGATVAKEVRHGEVEPGVGGCNAAYEICVKGFPSFSVV